MTATRVWVVDNTANEAYEFNHTGTLQSQFDTAGAGAASLKRHIRDGYQSVGGRWRSQRGVRVQPHGHPAKPVRHGRRRRGETQEAYP